MTPPTEVFAEAFPRERRRVATDLFALTKPRVVLMVLVTTLVGFYVGSPGPLDFGRLVHALVGTALAAAGMRRTRMRPLPDGRIQPLEALAFGTLVTVAGLAYSVIAVGPLVGLVTLATTVLYLFAYTPLKLRTPFCMIVGAVPGALPPVTGWVAARGEFGAGAWILFSILFLWQLPHTLAIARLYRDDYARAGVRVLPVVDPDGDSTERQIVIGCLALLAAGLLPTVSGLAGVAYFTGALLLGLVFLAFGMAQAVAPSTAAARRVLFASLLYLPALLVLLALDKT
ncbi:MAG: protoheme IX farnesyltransferase [Candidatus Rokubacteria bacterium]|nr:protoheme IX farnesyltransferase [Candidatus Rokubacteria bacterium]